MIAYSNRETMADIHVGTSGYVYRHWRGTFYPKGLPSSRWLEHYAEVFATLELNNTFYKLPTTEAVTRWSAQTPPGFLFACKGSRFLTHMKRLTDVTVGMDRFFSAIRKLGRKTGPILWQLPPNMNLDLERLKNFLEHLPKGHRYAVEFRNESWYGEEVCALLEERGIAFCEHDLVRKAPPRPTAEFRYLRFHGTSGPYRGRYGARALRPVAQDLSRWCGMGKDAFVYFNNDQQGHAVEDALALLGQIDLCARASPRPRKRSVRRA